MNSIIFQFYRVMSMSMGISSKEGEFCSRATTNGTKRTWSQEAINTRKRGTVLRTHCYNNSLKWIVKGLKSSHVKFLISKSGISPVSFQTVLDNYVSNCSFVTTYSAPIVPSLMMWQCFRMFLAFSTNADCSSFERELNLLCQKSYMT